MTDKWMDLGSIVKADSTLMVSNSSYLKTELSDESINNILEKLQNRLQYTKDVIVPCEWCGQFGAVKTNCRFCSRPIKGD